MATIKHVVLLKVAKHITQHQISEVFAGLRELTSGIPGLLDFSGGANNSPEGKTLGFTHGFVMTFADSRSRARYLPHPLHVHAAQAIQSILESGEHSVLVLDWESV
jgi:stress responsive alpha/beta barrel protein